MTFNNINPVESLLTQWEAQTSPQPDNTQSPAWKIRKKNRATNSPTSSPAYLATNLLKRSAIETEPLQTSRVTASTSSNILSRLSNNASTRSAFRGLSEDSLDDANQQAPLLANTTRTGTNSDDEADRNFRISKKPRRTPEEKAEQSEIMRQFRTERLLKAQPARTPLVYPTGEDFHMALHIGSGDNAQAFAIEKLAQGNSHVVYGFTEPNAVLLRTSSGAVEFKKATLKSGTDAVYLIPGTTQELLKQNDGSYEFIPAVGLTTFVSVKALAHVVLRTYNFAQLTGNQLKEQKAEDEKALAYMQSISAPIPQVYMTETEFLDSANPKNGGFMLIEKCSPTAQTPALLEFAKHWLTRMAAEGKDVINDFYPRNVMQKSDGSFCIIDFTVSNDEEWLYNLSRYVNAWSGGDHQAFEYLTSGFPPNVLEQYKSTDSLLPPD